jgi:hypothetical protein
MSDRTYAWAVVYGCPRESYDAILAAIIDDTGLWETADDGSVVPGERSLVLGDKYSDPECRCGATDGLATTLLELGCTFECGEDARYDYPGLLLRGAPSLGLHVAIQVAGEPYVRASQLLAAIARTSERDDLVSILHELAGTAWADAIGRCETAIPS